MSFGADVPVVVAASASWETPSPVNAHHVARRLAARGHRVLFVESTGLRAPAPLAARHDLSRMARRLGGFARGLREEAPGLFVLSPLGIPGGGPAALRRGSLRFVGAQVARGARRLGMEAPVVWAFLPSAVGWMAALAPRLAVYHCVDDYAGNPGVDAAWIDALEREMLRRADCVLATSPVLLERLRGARPDAVPAFNVADVALFGRAVSEELPEPAELAGLPRPRFAYVGNLAAYRIAFPLLEALADAWPGGSLVLVGARGLGDVGGADAAERRLLARANVHALPPRPQAELPALLRHVDAGLVPFADNRHTRASLPLKLWEYLAAGLPVVARDLPNLRTLADEGWIHVAAEPAGFVQAAAAALAEPRSRREARRARAAAHDWASHMDRLCGLVARALEGGTRRTGSGG